MALKIAQTLGNLFKPSPKPAQTIHPDDLPDAGKDLSELPPWEGPEIKVQPKPEVAPPDLPCLAHIWNAGTCVKCGKTKTVIKPASMAAQAQITPRPTLTPTPIGQSAPVPAYSILDAINEKFKGRKGTLMLVSAKTGEGFKVKDILECGPTEAHVQLTGNNGMAFRPKIGAREVPLYTPVWR